MRLLHVPGCFTAASTGAGEASRLTDRLATGALLEPVSRPLQQRQGDRHAGRRAESEWALLEGFFASPSLNESNP